MIESENNQRIKKYSKLKDKKYRDEYNLFIVEGQYLIKEALKQNYIHEIFLLDGEENSYGGVTFGSKEVLEELSRRLGEHGSVLQWRTEIRDGVC